MMRRKSFLIILGLAFLLFTSSLLFKRDTTFVLFTDGEFEKDVVIQFVVDKELIYNGVVGLHMFGYKLFSKKLCGGIHKIKLMNDSGNVLLDTYFIVVLKQTYVITFWFEEEDKMEIETENRFRRFYFE